ncbi:MAG: AMP-binding protein, partial [Deltaproteobacteria bacterium]|nr:AMP-binding protein [Deltaproteobacteria bacterium]
MDGLVKSPSTGRGRVSPALDDFRASAARRPEAPAVCYFDHEISYGEIDRLSNSLAAAFYDLGLKKGDRILLVLQNVPQFLIATYAAWKLGAIVVPLNPMYKEKELTYFFQDSGAKLFFTLDQIAAALDMSFLKETSVQKVITTSPLDMLPPGVELPDMLKGKKKIFVPVTLDFNARVYEKMQRIDENDVVLGVAPLFHVTGEVAHLAIAALAGIPVVLYYRFDAGETLRLIERWKVTVTVASITVYIALMNHPNTKKRDISSFVKAYSGGAPVSEAVVDQFEELTGLYLYNVYGMTETNSPSHIVPWGER